MSMKYPVRSTLNEVKSQNISESWRGVNSYLSSENGENVYILLIGKLLNRFFLCLIYTLENLKYKKTKCRIHRRGNFMRINARADAKKDRMR